MSLNKAIKSGREHRKQYRGAKYVDRTCRNHGGRRRGAANECPYCLSNRLYKNKKREQKIKEELKEIEYDNNKYIK